MNSRVFNVASCVVPDGSKDNTLRFEPGNVLSQLPMNWSQTDPGLIVLVRDEGTSLEFRLETFLSKDYRVNGEFVWFSGKRLKLSRLTLHIGYKISLADLDAMTESRLD
jgi:hypothetical protein